MPTKAEALGTGECMMMACERRSTTINPTSSVELQCALAVSVHLLSFSTLLTSHVYTSSLTPRSLETKSLSPGALDDAWSHCIIV